MFHNWGATATERAASYPCDALLHDPGDQHLWRALDVDAPAATVYRWLCQMRVAPYSYDWIDNLGRQSPRTLTPGLDALSVGQRIAVIFKVASFEPGRHVTMRSGRALFGDVAVSYVIDPRGADRSRLVVKLIVRYPRGPYGWLLRRALPFGDLIMMRKQLLNFRALAESHPQGNGAMV